MGGGRKLISMLLKPTILNSENGLPNEQVHSVRQDRFGRLWMATPAGLTCYNGSDIKLYDTRDGLECLGLRTIHISEEDIIWIGTDRGIEAMDLSGQKKILNLNFSWVFGIADSILVEGSDIWIGTSYGLLKLKESTANFQLEYKLPLGLVRDMLRTGSDDLLLVTGKQGLIKLKDKEWTPLNPNLPVGDSMICIEKTVDSQILAGTTEGLFLLSEEEEILEHLLAGQANKKVTAIAVLGDEWWLAVDQSLYLAEPSSKGIQIKEKIPVHSQINDLFIDYFSNVWASTYTSGLRKISCLRNAIKPLSFGKTAAAFSIYKEQKSNQLLFCGDGFSALVKDNAKGEEISARLLYELDTIVWDSCIDPIDKSVIWYATQDGLYRSKDGKKPLHYEVYSNVMNSPNRFLLCRGQELWVGTISGLYRILNDKIEEISDHNGQKFGYVYTLALNEKNQLWIGTLGQGLWLETVDGIILIDTSPLMSKGNTYAVDCNDKGNTVVIQEERVVLIDSKGDISLLYQEYPMVGWCLKWVDDATVAIGSNNGIVLISVSPPAFVRRINLHLNKADWQFACSRSLYIDKDQKFFCALNGGMYMVDLKKVLNFSSPPGLYVNEIHWQNVAPKRGNRAYKLTYGKWSVSVSVYAAWFVDEAQVQYRFKIVGFDNNWSKLSDLPTMNFNSLPPGEYQIQAQVFTPFTGFGEVVNLFSLEVSAPRWADRLGPVFDSANSLYNKVFASRIRNRVLLERNLDLEAEIQERKKAEKELQNYKERLEEMVAQRTHDLMVEKERVEAADKMKTAFLANMSHEIRTPISGIIGLNKLLDKTILDKMQQNYISKINISANHLLQIINDVLDISKIESGKTEMEMVPFSLDSTLHEIYTFGEIRLLEKNVQLEIKKEFNTGVKLIGDPLRVKQVLINLLSNAIKFSEEGTIFVKAIQVDSIIEKVGIKFVVTDSGIGMSEDQLEHLFEAFQQADSSISRKYGGTGLGLNISYRFVELMGGQLEVESELGKGTSFYFSLHFDRESEIPKKESDLKPALASEEIAANAHPKATNGYLAGFEKIRNASVLIAEDDEINQLIVSTLLAHEGFDVTLVNNGEECIQIVNENPHFDYLLMDVQMPEIDGLSASRFIRTELKNDKIVIIALTADALSGIREKVLDSGMNDLLTKPVKKEELFATFLKWKQ